MIIGLALVVDDISKGQRLVFRYPPKEQQPIVTGAVSSALAADRAAEFHSIDSDTFAKLFRPKSILCQKTLEVVIEQIRFISHPTEVKFDAEAPAISTTGVSPPRGDMIFFNVVVALTATPVDRSGPLQQQLDLYAGGGGEGEDARHHRTHHNQIKAVAANLSAVLLHEERRCGYVSREVRAMLAIREQHHQARKQLLAKTGAQHGADAGSDQVEDARVLVDAILESSPLARDLKEVYQGLARGTGAHIRLNNWISMNFRTVEGGGRTRPWTAYWPFETLLLVEDEDKARGSLYLQFACRFVLAYWLFETLLLVKHEDKVRGMYHKTREFTLR